MRGGLSQRGYALLVVLLVMVLAGAFTMVLVGAVHTTLVVEGADSSRRRATAAERDAAAALADELRWHPVPTGTLHGGDAHGGPSWQAAWSRASSATPWPRVVARVDASAGNARRSSELVLEWRAEPWAMGVTCEQDAEIDARLVLAGTGLYVGGALRGREHVTMAEDAGGGSSAGRRSDLVHDDVYSGAAVHGGAGIFSRGSEIHGDAAACGYPDDSDRHVGIAVPSGWLAGPSHEFLLGAGRRADTPGSALRDGVLHLGEMGPVTGREMEYGRCVLVSEEGEVAIEGAAPATAGRLLVVVCGDAAVGRPGETAVLSGGLVVCGHLEMRGALILRGSLHARDLTVRASASVTVPADWREQPLAGAVLPTLVERSRLGM